jgi:hypothetical protein
LHPRTSSAVGCSPRCLQHMGAALAIGEAGREIDVAGVDRGEFRDHVSSLQIAAAGSG